MSVFIEKSCCSGCLLERIMDALADLMNLTRMDLGQHCCIWLEFLNFPRQKWSLMHWGWIELSVSTLEMTVIMFFRSLLKHSGLGVPFGHSSMPQLNNNFCLAGENIRVGNKCLVVECIEALRAKERVLGLRSEVESQARNTKANSVMMWVLQKLLRQLQYSTFLRI